MFFFVRNVEHYMFTLQKKSLTYNDTSTYFRFDACDVSNAIYKEDKDKRTKKERT